MGSPVTVQERFNALKPRLRQIWAHLEHDPGFPHTSVIVPSLSVNQEELTKVQGASYYEERLLFALIRLRNPNARLIYVTSHPVHPEVIDYYLQLLVGVPASHGRQRLRILALQDASPQPLTAKVLARPRVVERLRSWIGDPERAYLTCYNSTVLERQLAVELGIPLNGVDPELLYLGTKSGSRRVFAEAGVPYPAGREGVRSEDEVVGALAELKRERPGIRRAVVKLNDGFSGEGNGLFEYPAGDASRDSAALRKRLAVLTWASPQETYPSFARKLKEMGGVVEEFLDGEEVHSPSTQLRIHPDGRCTLVSTHEQVLGGDTGQVYLGCRFPARDAYRLQMQEEGLKIGRVLSSKGVIGRFGVDFLVTRQPGGQWNHHALEINLRMGGTTPPYMALEFLTGGGLQVESGHFHGPNHQAKFYAATDNLKSPSYRGLLPEDLMDFVTTYGIHFGHSTGTGVLFYMIGALSEFGKLGMTCIGNSRHEAEQLFAKTVTLLDAETGSGGPGRPAPIFDNRTGME